MKKITILSSRPPIKWVSYYTLWFVEAMDKLCHIQFLGFENIYPEFLYPNWTKDHTLKTPQLKHTTLRNKINWYNPISRIIAWFKIQWDVLHIQRWSWVLAPIYITILIIAKYFKKVKIIATIHNVLPHEKSFIKNIFNKSIYTFTDKFIVHSKDNKEQLEWIIWSKKPIQIIPHWIIYPNTERVNKTAAREKYKLHIKDKVLLFFWNIRDYKWLDILLEAFSIILQKDNTYKLIIAWSNREPWEKYRKIIDTKKLNDFIIRLDWFIPENELWYIFWASDLLILPYKHFDAQSGVVALNFAFDLPLIISNLGWLTEAIEDKDLIFKVWNHKDLAEKISTIFDGNLLEEKINYIKERKKSFEWNTIIKKTLDFYNL